MKRVYTLYRVSTVKQVDVVKDDIPMQRIACHNFAEKMGWAILKEMEEKGVSGFKVSAAKRDAIQELKEAAVNKEFDILLVFMFDRLGRIENETPFVLEWFTSHDIEVWSVNEGQQKFDNHVDKLMNYIRFWQASGESEKTSIRVKTRLQQMTSEGVYTGGVVPYGYQLVSTGRLNKKGQEMRDLAINPEEANVVRLMFNKVVNEGYGSHMLAELINKRGFRNHNGQGFRSNHILRILKNEIYRGFMVRGEVRSERIESLRVVSDADYLKAQKFIELRNGKNEEKRNIALTNRGNALLSGIIYCAHCGCRLTTSRYKGSYIREDGSLYQAEHGRYICYHKSRRINDCDGATTYNADKIDNAVLEAMRQIFASISGCPQEEKIQSAYKKMMAGNHHLQQKLEAETQKDTKQLENLRAEIVKALSGDSVYTQEDLATALQTLRSKLAESQKKLEELKAEDAEKKAMSDGILPAYRQFRTWAVEFEESSFEAKKMIATQLFSRVEVGKGYVIHYELNFTYKQFCDEWMTINKKMTATG